MITFLCVQFQTQHNNHWITLICEIKVSTQDECQNERSHRDLSPNLAKFKPAHPTREMAVQIIFRGGVAGNL